MKVGIHFPSLYEAPDAVWWDTPEGPTGVFATEQGRILSQTTMSMLTEPDADVEDFFSRLAGRQPVTGTWEVAELSPSMSPAELLKMLRSQATQLLRSA